jgi:hypothetical protein
MGLAQIYLVVVIGASFEYRGIAYIVCFHINSYHSGNFCDVVLLAILYAKIV